MRLRSLATPGLILLLALPVLGVGCPQPEKEKPAATTDEKTKDKKKDKGDDDDDDDKGAKKKKKKKKADESDDDTTVDAGNDEAQGNVDGGHNEDAAAVAAVPIPAPCAPDPAGKLGAKPKLLTSGGEPGISIAMWGKANETPLSTVAVTIHADARCYVDYLAMPPGDPMGGQWMGFDVPKGAVSAMTGVSERGAANFVGFRVTYHEPFRNGQELHSNSKALFYGYQNANGVPYSCGAIPGEKQCAMYQKPLVAQTGVACTIAKGGGPPDVLGQIKIGGGKIDIKQPPPISTLIVVPSTIPLIDAGAADADAGTCNGPTCITNAFMVKDKDHVYVRLSAGKPSACDAGSGPKVGDTWYFDESAWKKR